jgi:hypothetical protein
VTTALEHRLQNIQIVYELFFRLHGHMSLNRRNYFFANQTR